MTTPKRFASLFTLIAFAFVAVDAGAADWIGGDDGYWGTAANWKNSSGPDADGYVSGDAFFKSDDISGYDVWFDKVFNLKYQVKIENGSETPLVFKSAGESFGICSDSTKDSNNYHRLSVGYDTDGWLRIEGGSYSFQNAIYVAEKEKDGNPAVDGKLEVLGGSLATDDGINVGHSAGKTGTMIVGGGSVTSTAEAFIGAVSSATGILTVTNGTFTAAGGLTLGSGGSANGTFNLSQDGVVNVTGGDFIVCKNNAGAIGAFDVSDGTLTIANALKHGYVGSAKNATGAISGGKVSVGTDLSVGHGASTEASLTISGSADVMAKNFMVAQGSGASGDVTISGGAVAVTNLYMACNGNGGGGMGTTASLAVDGGTLDVGSGVKFGHVGGSTAVLKVDGGEVTVAGRIFQFGGDTTGRVEVASGALSVVGELYMGSSYAGSKMTLKMSGGDATFANISLNGGDSNNSGLNVVNEIVLEGGVVTVNGVTINGNYSNMSSSIAFRGGTIRASDSANGTFIPSDSRMAVTVEEAGGAIDTNGKNVTIASAISGTGTLTKKGAGTLTFTETPACPIRIEGGNVVFPENAVLTAKITVAAGAVYVYDSSLTYTGGIEVGEGGFVVMENAAYTSGIAYDIPAAITFAAGATAAGNLMIKTGARTSVSFSGSTYTITDEDAETPVTTMWLGGATGQFVPQGGGTVGEFYYNGNWTHGAPNALDTAVIASDCTIRSWESTKHSGRHPMYELVLKNGATLTFLSGWPSNRQPALQPQKISGNGTLRLGSTGIVYNETADCVISDTVAVEFIEGPADKDVARPSWVEGGSKGVIFYGPVRNPSGAFVASGSYVQFIGAVDISSSDSIVYTENDDTKTVRTSFYNCTMNGAVVLNGRAEFYNTVVNGNISGAGQMDVLVPSGNPNTSTVTLSGDNSGFSGTVYATRNINFAAAAAGSAKAYWDLPNCDVEISAESGTLKLGHLNCAGNKKLFKMAGGKTPNGLVIEVGKGVIIGKKYFDNGAGLDVTLRKVAFGDDEPGTFIYAGYGFPKIEVAAGELAFRDDSSDSDAYVQATPFAVAAEVTVDAGATIGGTNAVSISSLTLADGAFIAGPGTKLTNVGTATLEGADGVKVLVADATALTAGTRYNLITATEGVNGRPYGVAVDASGADVAASNGNEKEFWLARVRGKILHLVEANPRAGLQIILR